MPSAVWVEGEGLTVIGDELRFVVVDNDQAAGGGLQLLDQFPVAGASRMDVQGCRGVHGVASLCGGRVRQISRIVFIMSTRIVIICDYRAQTVMISVSRPLDVPWRRHADRGVGGYGPG